jgi:hypothetical protein
MWHTVPQPVPFAWQCVMRYHDHCISPGNVLCGTTTNVYIKSVGNINYDFYTPAPPEGAYCFTSVRPSVRLSFRPSVLPSVQDMFRRIFLCNYWWQKSDIWSQASYRYVILWEAFVGPPDSYFLFADLVGFYTHWTYIQGYHKWALAHSSSCLS